MVRGGLGLRLPTEPCVLIPTRLLMQDIFIEKRQTNELASSLDEVKRNRGIKFRLASVPLR